MQRIGMTGRYINGLECAWHRGDFTIAHTTRIEVRMKAQWVAIYIYSCSINCCRT